MVLFKNSQWVVTDTHVQSVKPAPDYHFEIGRLTEAERAPGETYDWPVHMAEKTWVDIEAFIEAFEQGLTIHTGKYKPPVDASILTATIVEARKEAKQR